MAVLNDVEKQRQKEAKNEKEEDLMDLVGGDGPWQRWILFFVVLCPIPDSSHNLSMSFFAPNIDYWCARPDGLNISVEQWKAVAMPSDDPHCSMYKFINITNTQEEILIDEKMANSPTVSCDSWEYDDTDFSSTVLGKFDLVCSSEWLISMSKSIFIAGYFVSNIVFGYLSDKIGRRPVIILSDAVAVIAAIACAFSTSYYMFIICRFFIAAGVLGVDNAVYVLMMEVIGPKHRSAYGMIGHCGWAIGCVFLAILAWFLRDWFWIHLAITLPSIFLLSGWWLFPESPRWLLTHGKTDEALEVLSIAGKRNGKYTNITEAKIKEIVSKCIKEQESEKKGSSIFELFKPGMWKKTLIIFFLWSVNGFIYYGISYNTNEFAGDPFLNFTFCALIEIPSQLMTIFIIQSKGRRYPLSFSLAGAGLAVLLVDAIPADYPWVKTALFLAGKFCITASFCTLTIMTAEIFPTTVRNAGIGLASINGQLGSSASPFLRELGKATHPVVGHIVFGVLAATGSFLVLLLPETNNCNMPDTIREATEVQR